MKVKQLIKELSTCDPEDEVVIPVVQARFLGSEPCVRIGYISRGFDWDNGKVFIRPIGRIRLKEI